MDCENIRNLIEQEASGKLSERDRAELDSHAAACASCREFRQAALAVASALSAVPLETFPVSRSRQIMALVRELPVPARQSIWSRLAGWLTPSHTWAYAAVPGLALLLLALWPQPAGLPDPAGTRPEDLLRAGPHTQWVTAQPTQLPPVLGTLRTTGAGATLAGLPIAANASVELRAGQVIALGQAPAVLEYRDGTRVRLEGPALAAAEERRLVLERGRLLASVRTTGAHFLVEAGSLRVEVMGTRFSVDAAAREVRLLEGKVVARDGKLSAQLAPGQAIDFGAGATHPNQLSEPDRQKLTREFIAFEGPAVVAAALGLDEDRLRESVRQKDLEIVGQPAARPATATARPAAPPSAPPVERAPTRFDPIQGLQN